MSDGNCGRSKKVAWGKRGERARVSWVFPLPPAVTPSYKIVCNSCASVLYIVNSSLCRYLLTLVNASIHAYYSQFYQLRFDLWSLNYKAELLTTILICLFGLLCYPGLTYPNSCLSSSKLYRTGLVREGHRTGRGK